MGTYRNTKPRANAIKNKHAWHPQRPLQPQIHQGHYTLEDKQDAVWLIDNGWHPIDVGYMLGMRVFRPRGHKPGMHCGIYQAYSNWADKLELLSKEDH